MYDRDAVYISLPDDAVSFTKTSEDDQPAGPGIPVFFFFLRPNCEH